MAAAAWTRQHSIELQTGRQDPFVLASRARIPSLFVPAQSARVSSVNFLTKQQQLVLCVVVVLLLIGLAVKIYRTAHPPSPSTATAAP
jgi:hypothetical protein